MFYVNINIIWTVETYSKYYLDSFKFLHWSHRLIECSPELIYHVTIGRLLTLIF